MQEEVLNPHDLNYLGINDDDGATLTKTKPLKSLRLILLLVGC